MLQPTLKCSLLGCPPIPVASQHYTQCRHLYAPRSTLFHAHPRRRRNVLRCSIGSVFREFPDIRVDHSHSIDVPPRRITVRSTSWTMQIGASFFARFATGGGPLLRLLYLRLPRWQGTVWPAECPIPSRRVVLAEL